MTRIPYLILIPARAGSKIIKDKNMKPLCGKPLVQWTFEAALESKLTMAVHCSSDDPRIISLAKSLQIEPFHRPAHLAQDDSSILQVIMYHLDLLEKEQGLEVENLIVLQATSPIRESGLVDNCIKAFENSGRTSLITVSDCIQHPFDCVIIDEDKVEYLTNFDEGTNRQNYRKFYFITGSIYIAKTSMIRKERRLMNESTYCYLTSKKQSVDINDELDWIIAQSILEHAHD